MVASIVQSSSPAGAGATFTLTLTLPSPTAAGNCVVVRVGVASATAATSSNAALIGIADECAGLPTSGAVDKTSTGTGTANAWSSGATATTGQAAEIWFGAFCGVSPNSGRTITGPSSPWVNTGSSAGSLAGLDEIYFMGGRQIMTSTGAAAYSGTSNDGTSTHWAAVAVTFKAAGGGGNRGLLAACFP